MRISSFSIPIEVKSRRDRSIRRKKYKNPQIRGLFRKIRVDISRSTKVIASRGEMADTVRSGCREKIIFHSSSRAPCFFHARDARVRSSRAINKPRDVPECVSVGENSE